MKTNPPTPDLDAKPSVKDDGGPAFPQSVLPGVIGAGCGPHVEWGMTLRDWFASNAMQGLIVDPERVDQSREECARLAYLMADAMLKARAAK